MKKKQLAELKDKTIKELEKLVAEKSLGVAKLRAELAVGRHKNLHVASSARRDLAQLKTVLQERQGGN